MQILVVALDMPILLLKQPKKDQKVHGQKKDMFLSGRRTEEEEEGDTWLQKKRKCEL